MKEQILPPTSRASAKSSFWGLLLIAMFACLLGVSVGMAMFLDWLKN